MLPLMILFPQKRIKVDEYVKETDTVQNFV